MVEEAVAVLIGRNDDGQSITLMMNDRASGGLLAHVRLEASEIGDLIAGLADARADLPDEVPREIDPGSRLLGAIDPAWRTMHNPEANVVQMALRHPGIGWVAYALPPREAEALGRSLMSLANPK